MRSCETILRIEPGFSSRLALFVVLSHVAGLIAAAVLPVAVPLRLALGLLVVISLVYAFNAHVLRRGRSALTAVELDSVAGWSLYTSEGVVKNASLHPSSFIRPWLMVLNFSVGRFGSRSMILSPDAVDRDSLRRLRVQLRILPQEQR